MKRISWASFSRRRGLKIKDWFSKPDVSTYQDLARALDQINVIAPPEDDPEVISILEDIKKEEQDRARQAARKALESKVKEAPAKSKKKKVAKTKESATSNEDK